MSPRLTGFLVAPVLAAVGAIVLSQGADTPSAPHTPSPTPRATAAPTVAPPAVATATQYALAARNWTAQLRIRAWRQQLALAAGDFRRELAAAKPSAEQLRALREDHAASAATVVSTRLTARARTRETVLVDLHERTSAGGAVLDGTTRNRVELLLGDDGWRVVGFTVIPGAAQ